MDETAKWSSDVVFIGGFIPLRTGFEGMLSISVDSCGMQLSFDIVVSMVSIYCPVGFYRFMALVFGTTYTSELVVGMDLLS